MFRCEEILEMNDELDHIEVVIDQDYPEADLDEWVFELG